MTLVVNSSDTGMRIDAFIAKHSELSRSAAQRLIDTGCVSVGGITVQKKRLLREGECVEIDIPMAREYEVEAENIPLDIVYEDSDIIVINKPSGMVVHPAPGNYSSTLVNALLYHARDSLSGIGGVMRPGIVHRIDKDTSGLLVVAKNDAAHAFLSQELSYHNIIREYRALVSGGFKTDGGTVKLPIGRHPKDRKKMAVLPKDAPGAKEAVTHYTVLCTHGGISYLKLVLETGRTHQIRVHMSHLGHALLGDEIYAGAKTRFEREHSRLFCGQMLHAISLTLTHPRTKERMTFTCPLPDNFQRALEILESENE